jgi:alpha-N-arabinofuranosidase
MRPEYYADVYRRFQTFVKNYPGSKVSKIACGSSGEDLNWTEVLMDLAGKHMNGLSLHWYTLPTGNWNKKGAATNFPREQWHSTLVKTWRLDELITKHSAIMDKHDPQKKVGLIVDEWGTIRDAVAAGINFHIFHKHTDRVTMATIAQTVNVLQAVILTDKDRMILTPTYHVFEMFKVHQGATVLPTEIDAPTYDEATAKIPSVSASATRDAGGKTHLSIVNAHLDRPASVTIQLQGLSPRKVSARVLTADKMDTHNTFDQPQNVQPVSLEGVQIDKERITVALPARSVTVFELE